MSSSADLPPHEGSYITQFFKSQWTPQPIPPKDLDLTDQTAIITGGNGGLGLQCARTLLEFRLSKLIITVRDTKKGDEIIAELRNSCPGTQIEAWPLDLLSHDSVMTFAQRCKGLERLDFAILNAGYTQPSFEVSPATKHEKVFQVNYLSTVLLALLLLPILKEKHPKGKPGRITMVGSAMAFIASFPEQKALAVIPALDDPLQWNTQRYNTTKLMLMMFLVKIKDFVNQDDVVVNIADPGLTRNSGLDRNAPVVLRTIISWIRKLIGRSTKTGVWTYIDAAVVKPNQSHGSLIYDWAVFP
jgi:NAD(P)-dependent dehydrogenase (short-subunit alcohol dehydrogenase family)